MSNDTQPEIRFPGFTEDWEQRKFKEIINERREKTKVENEDILLSSAIKGMFLNSELFSHFRGSSNIGYLKIKKNDLILSAQNLHLGNCNVNLRFDSGIVSPAYKVYELVNAEPNYINSWLKRDTTKNFFLKATTEGASVCRKNIEWETLYSQKLYIPKIEEQIKIGNFFKQLDETIALHQRKLDLLKETKKGFLQKMFPKNGAKVPEIRFPGFTEDWEERKLQEVLRERNNQQPQSTEYPLVSFTVENGVTPKTDRYEREQLVVGDKSSKKYKVTVLNDIVYNPANLKFGAISRNKYGNAVFSPIYITFLVNNDVTTPEFIEMFVTRNDFIKRALKYQQGTVYERQSVSPTDLLAMNVYLPGKSEQEKIGSFFQQLDETIALHQRKLDLLKETKKGFLQKMFV
ncbi:restriction endonuclease subunit S [Enterococcus faecium]|uniref:restriction endonuclease subunit S n=1 Tax=Enterococcus faecium TaxID=1352 RepID=UPI00296A92CE|nr:restriction endonuclease subunit S [Enterococcus faecium]MDW3707442.1 restriction endonuclease subunit S [Enterococcus faecium]